jgi:hypothetical protein
MSGLQDSPVASGVYTLGGDQYEVDNSPTQAKLLQNGKPQLHSLFPAGDQDWATFKVSKNTDVYLDASMASPGCMVQMQLFGPNSSSISVPLVPPYPNKLTYIGSQELAPGTYYLLVTSPKNTVVPFYQLSLLTALPGQVAPVLLSPYPDPTSAYTGPVQVTMSCPTPQSFITYTTDGTDPTIYNQRYTSPVTLTQNTYLKAKSFRTGWLENVIAVGNYIITN